jgi:hypothetical protein
MTPSAVGDLQMLPMQTNRMRMRRRVRRIDRGGRLLAYT